MKSSLIAAGMLLAATSLSHAQGRPGACVDFFRYQWGADASTTGRVKSGGVCRTSFAYGAARTSGAEIVQQPAHGTLSVRQVGDSRAQIIYTAKRGYSGPDTFAVRIRGVTVGRTGAERPEAATKVTYNFTVTP
jgi:hypothetical protein